MKTMYDELIKNLRICATEANCKDCGLNDDGDCQEKLMKQAADAIEELVDSFETALKDVAEEDVPTADVAERKRGKWKRKWDHRNGFDYAYEVCSECGAPVNVCGYDYCPNCGAQMDGDSDV